MNTQPPQDDAQAARRFYVLSGVRIGSILALLLGLAIARSVVEGPYPLGVALAIGGMLAFFFGPYLLARRWKSSGTDEHR